MGAGFVAWSVAARAAVGQVVPVSARDEEEHDAPLDSSTSRGGGSEQPQDSSASHELGRRGGRSGGGGGTLTTGARLGEVSPCARLQMEPGAGHDEKCGRETEAGARAAPLMPR
jgi:hypothetical protein